MAVFVTGDIHGGFDLDPVRRWDRTVGHTLTRDDFLVVAGDFGYPWDFSDEEAEQARWLETRAYTVLFVDGNHECFDWWAGQPREEWRGGVIQRLRPHSPVRRLCRGEVFDLGGSSVFTLGGATSPDRDLRVEGVDWWPDELPGDDELAHARETLDACDWHVDYVITHTCPSGLLAKALYPSPNWRHPDRDRLTDFLDEVDARLTYKRWYFGHFHADRDVDKRHTLLFDEVVRLGLGVWK